MHISGGSGRTGSSGGPEGNELLTVATASVLFVLLAALGVTIVDMGALEQAHMILGVLVIPPVLLKLGSTGYRFVRYYTGSRPYRLKGPPLLPLRILAPPLVLTTVIVFVTGILLLADGHKVGTLLEVHKVSFIVWVALFGVHVLAYGQRVLRALPFYWRSGQAVPGVGLRAMLVATSLGAGAALTVTLLPAIDRWQP